MYGPSFPSISSVAAGGRWKTGNKEKEEKMLSRTEYKGKSGVSKKCAES